MLYLYCNFGHSILSLHLRALHTHCMALDLTYHVTFYLSVCSRNLASSARRRRPFRSITAFMLSWQSVSVSRCSRVISKRDVDSGYEWAHPNSLLTLPPTGIIMPQNSLETVNELIAGSFGGAAQVLVGQPLDTIKTRAQIAPSSVSFLSFTNSLSYHA